MTIKIPWEKSTISIDIPEERVAAVVEPNDVPEYNEKTLVEEALAKPVAGPSLQEFLADDQALLVIVNDGTRPTPTAKVMESLYPYLEKKDVIYLIATGVHRGPSEEEYRFIFGPLYERIKKQVRFHDARREEEMIFLGTSSAGSKLSINKLVVERPKTLIIGSVEPHYFAGYTGGRKAFFPGVASYESITMNHKLALSPQAKALALEDNPVHQDLMESLETLETEIFSIQAVLDKNQNIYAVRSGDIVASFEAAIDKAAEVFVVDIPQKADVVVSSARYPMDIDLYQSQKALDNGKLALKEKGSLILVSSCRDGVGGKAFYDLLSSCPSPAQVLEKIKETYVLGYHKAAKMAEVCLSYDVSVYSKTEDSIWEAIFMKPVHDLQKAVLEALEKNGPDSQVLFLLDGTVTVPRILKEE